MATINQKFTGDAAQLEKEYAKILAQQVKLEEQLGKIKNKADQTAKANEGLSGSITKAGTNAVVALRNMALGYASVQSAIQLVNAELKIKRELEDRAFKASLTVSEAQAQVAINLGDVSDQDFNAFIAKIGDIQKATGFESQVPLLNAAAATLSAVAGDQKITTDILATVAPIMKTAPDDMAQVAQVVGDLMLVSGQNAKDTTGLVLATMGQARVTNLQAFKNVAPAIAGSVATQGGVDPKQAAREAAAAFAAIGGVIKDPEGALTRTAVANLSKNLETAFPGELSFAQRLDMAQDMGDKISAAVAKGVAPDAKLVAVQADLIKSGFEGATQTVVRELLAGNDSPIAKSFDSALAKINFDGGFVDRLTTRLEGGTLQLQLAAQQKGLSGVVESAQLEGTAALRGSSRALYEQARDSVDMGIGGAIDRWADNLKAPIRDDADYLEKLRGMERYVRFGRAEASGPLAPSAPTDAELSPTQLAQVEVLRAAMRGIEENMKRNQVRQGAALQTRAQAESD